MSGEGGGVSNAGQAGAVGTGGAAGVGGALALGGGGWGNVANGAGWGPTGDLDPVPGDHDIVESRCDGAVVGPEYMVQPLLVCSHEYSLEGGTRADPSYVVCSVAPYCMHHSECTAQPFGRCEGSPSVGCRYPYEPCTTDADCVSAPNGSCPAYTEERRCESADRCWPIQPECQYPSAAVVCVTDADCNQRPGGECVWSILFARCAYDECASDSDCTAEQHCACRDDQRRCYSAECRSDADCASGQSCQASDFCHHLRGFYCTTPGDGCRSDDDCDDGRCEYDGTTFRCTSVACPTER